MDDSVYFFTIGKGLISNERSRQKNASRNSEGISIELQLRIGFEF